MGEQLRFKADSRNCLSVDANSFYNRQNVQLWECSRSSGQLFVWANGLIQVANAPRYCVVIDGNENRDGANIQLWECDSRNVHMQWNSRGNGLSLVANSNGRCMAVDNNHAYNGANVQLWSCDGYEYYKGWSVGHCRNCPGNLPSTPRPPSPPGPPGPVRSGEQLRFKADSRYC